MFKIKLNSSEVLEIDAVDKKMSWYEAQSMCQYSQTGFRLPTKSELELIYNELHLNGLGSFNENESYWSSDDNCLDQQVQNNYAWVLNFKNGECNLIELKSKLSLVILVKQKLITVENVLQEWVESRNHLFSKTYQKHSVQLAKNEDVFVISIISSIRYNNELNDISISKLFPTFSNSNRDYFQVDIDNLNKLLYWMEQNFILQINDCIN